MLWGAFICCLETINALNEFKLIIMKDYNRGYLHGWLVGTIGTTIGMGVAFLCF